MLIVALCTVDAKPVCTATTLPYAHMVITPTLDLAAQPMAAIAKQVCILITRACVLQDMIPAPEVAACTTWLLGKSSCGAVLVPSSVS